MADVQDVAIKGICCKYRDVLRTSRVLNELSELENSRAFPRSGIGSDEISGCPVWFMRHLIEERLLRRSDSLVSGKKMTTRGLIVGKEGAGGCVVNGAYTRSII